jgi:hypothetical protein
MKPHRVPYAVAASSPQAVAMVVSVNGFVACPLPAGLVGQATAMSLWDLYRLAYEQAVTALRPSFYERCLLGSTN